MMTSARSTALTLPPIALAFVLGMGCGMMAVWDNNTKTRAENWCAARGGEVHADLWCTRGGRTVPIPARKRR